MPEHAPRRPGGRQVVAAVLGLALLLLAWAGWQGWRGAQDLRAAADTLAAVRTDLAAGEGAVAELRRAGEQTAAARRHLSDPLLRVLGAVPALGTPLQSAADVARAADRTVRGGLLPLVAAAGPAPAERLAPGAGRLDVDYLADLAAPAADTLRVLRETADELAAGPGETWAAPVDQARSDLTADLSELSSTMADVALGLELAPALLGQGTTRRYLVVSQSPAEARGTGGLIGGYSLLEVTDGALSIVRSGSKSDLASPGEPVVDLGVQYDDHYGTNGATRGWINSNLSPHFPYAAQIWSALWERQYGEVIDGAVLLDPIALSYLLRAIGPVDLPDGSQVTADNVVDLTLRDVYARVDLEEQDAYLQTVSTAVAQALTTRDLPGRALVEALVAAVDERRLLLWSADPAVQERLAEQPISGHLTEGRRVVGDVIVDAAGSKLDYYLERDLRYVAGCGGPSRLTLALTNAAPAEGLPSYVTPEGFRAGGPPGTNILLATLYVPPGSIVSAVELDGAPVRYRQGTERGLEWIEVLVTLLPGQRAELAATFTEPPGTDGEVERLAQPLVREETFTATGC